MLNPHPDRKPTAGTWLLVAVSAVALAGLALRIANLSDVADSPFFSRPVIDGQAYDQWAQQIVAGKAPAEPFYQDPLYPYFLAAVYRVFGHSYWAVYIIQLLLGVALLLLVYDTARLLFDRRAGVVAMLLAAIYKPFLFYEVQVEKTALAVFLTGLFIWLMVRALGRDMTVLRPSQFLLPDNSDRVPRNTLRHLLWPLAAGIVLGLAALTRANVLLFAPVLVLALAFRHSPSAIRPSSFGLRTCLAALAGLVLVVAPVSIRNSVLAREFVLTTTQAGQNFYIGNNPYNRTGQYQVPPWVRANPAFEQLDFSEYARKTGGRDLTRSGVSRFYLRAALDWARSKPQDFARLLWRKTVLFFNDFEVPDNQDLYFFARYSWVLRLPLVSFGLLFALGLAGMAVAGWRTPGRLALVIFFFTSAIGVVLFFVFSRYRVPALVAVVPFAGGIVSWLWDKALAGPARQRLVRVGAGLLLVAAGFLAASYPVERGSGKLVAAQSLVNLGSQYYTEGDTARSVSTYLEALEILPGHAAALRTLGIMAYNRNVIDSAMHFLINALLADSADPLTHHYVGKVYERRGDAVAARLEYQRAVDLAPGRVEYRFSLATALQKLKLYDQALAQYDTMVQIAPDNPLVHHNLAVGYYNVGRYDEALVELETARRLGGPVNQQFEKAIREARP